MDDFIDTVRAVSDSVHETDKKGASVAHYLAMKGRKDLLEHALICGAGKQTPFIYFKCVETSISTIL